jgi:hypothetical protein
LCLAGWQRVEYRGINGQATAVQPVRLSFHIVIDQGVELLNAFAGWAPGGPDPALAALRIPGRDLTFR